MTWLDGIMLAALILFILAAMLSGARDAAP